MKVVGSQEKAFSDVVEGLTSKHFFEGKPPGRHLTPIARYSALPL